MTDDLRAHRASRDEALRSARSASQQVRDDALRAEVILLREENEHLRAKLEASQLLADQAIKERDAAVNEKNGWFRTASKAADELDTARRAYTELENELMEYR